MTQVATILVKRQSDGYQLWGRRRDTNLYTTPGGKFEDDETPEQAAARELFEEAGIVANPNQLVKLGVREFPERNLTVHCFVAIVPDSVKPSSVNDPDHEVSVWEWLPTMPIDTHAKPNALEPYARPKFTLRKLQTRAPGQVNFTVIQSIIAPTDNNKIFKFIASTNEVDRHGTRLLPRGCQHINFDKNPVFLWNHNKDGLPDDVIGRVFTLEVTDSAIIATVEFMTERPDGSKRERAWQCWQDVLAGILKAVSVGFVPLAESPVFKSPEESAKYLAGVGVIDVTQWDLCELSLCPIGSNPDALQVRKLSMRKSFTISCRDVTDASGHKHGADGRFGSGGSGGKSDDKPKKKLGAAAEKHSAAAHEAKTHEAHSKAGKAHAAVARAALKRGDTDKAVAALAQAKSHRDEAKRLKNKLDSSAAKPEVKPVPALAPVGNGGSTGLVKKPEEPKSSGPKADPNASKSSKPKGEAKPTRSDSPVPLTKGAKDAAAKATSLNAKGHFGHEKHDAIAAAHGEAAAFHEAAAAAHRGNKSVGTINEVGEHVTGNHSAAAAHDQAAELHREAQKAHLALGSNSRYAKLLRLSQNNPNVNEAHSAYESAMAQKEAVTGGSKVGLYIKQNDATKAAAAASKATKARNLLHSRALDDSENYDDEDDYDDYDDDDDVEPDDSIDLDSEIEELEKLIAQKRYSARSFTIRRVPISSKG